MKNVLVFPCGSEVGLEVHRALTDSTHFNLFGASSIHDHGKFVFKNYTRTLPFIDDISFIDELNKLINQYKIDFIIPAHDSAVVKMATHEHEIKAVVVTSSAEACQTCRSKLKTYNIFKTLLATPYIYSLHEAIKFPVFLKPDVGQGSKGTYQADSKADIEFYLNKDPSLLILEYLPGKEYTIDCFTDKNGNLLLAKGRERARICNGISVNSKPVNDTRFQEIATIINNQLSLRGVWFYQVKERINGDLVLMEIAPRIAGTMALFRADGINFAQLSLFDRMGVSVKIIQNNLTIEIDRALSSTFSITNNYEYIYIDFDDTLIINNFVNIDIIKFLYQSKNIGKKIILISKHCKNIHDSLKKYAISELLFNDIIILNKNDRKCDYITNKNSIFIDDSFSERDEVFTKLNIPVFALDAIEALITSN